MTVQPQPPRLTLEAITEEFNCPLVPENPFPTCITARNSAVVERFGEWADAQRAKVEADLERLQDRHEAAEGWELNALAGAVREWRVFAAFHRLHQENWCPALLFRLATKTDLLALCDPASDSSAAGFGDRQKQVLAKRGIADRFTWAASRRIVATMGPLEATAVVPDAEEVKQEEDTEMAPAVDVAGDGAPGPVEAAAVVITSVSAEEVPGEKPCRVEVAPAEEAEGEEERTGRVLDDALPPVRLDRVWSALPTYTKKQLEAVHERFGVGLWSQFGDRFYSSMRKPEMLSFVRRVVRHHASLDAAQQLTDRQLESLYDWMRTNMMSRCQSDDDLRIAARLFGDLKAGALLSRDGHGLSPDAWNRYREAEIRRIAAFCYHRFYEVSSSRGVPSEAAEVALD